MFLFSFEPMWLMRFFVRKMYLFWITAFFKCLADSYKIDKQKGTTRTFFFWNSAFSVTYFIKLRLIYPKYYRKLSNTKKIRLICQITYFSYRFRDLFKQPFPIILLFWIVPLLHSAKRIRININFILCNTNKYFKFSF